MNKVLITGASGLLGSNLVRDWADAFEVTGVVYQHPVDLPGAQIRKADLSDLSAVRQLVEQVQPELVIHCAAATKIDECERDPRMARRLNRDMAGAVATASRSAGARLIHISTDSVYDGQQGGYRETDPPSPINAYGQSKLEGEAVVREAHPSALIVRTNIFGWNLGLKRNLAEWFLARLVEGKQCPGFTDVWFSPILVNLLGKSLLVLAETDASGVLHIGGATCLSKYEFGVKLANAFGYDPELIWPAELSDAGLGARRGQRLCLDSSQAELLLGRPMAAVDDGIKTLWELRDRSPLALGVRSGVADAGV